MTVQERRLEEESIPHCGWKKCRQKKIVLIQRDGVTGVDRGICEKHREVATARAGWTTIQEFGKW